MWDLLALITMATALLGGLANCARSTTHHALWHVSAPASPAQPISRRVPTIPIRRSPATR